MSMNMRPRGNPDAPMYSPHRDIAHLGPELLKTAARLFDSSTYGQEFEAELQKVGISEYDFGAVAAAVGKATRLFMMTPTIEDPGAALASSGFFDTPKLANRMFLAGFGELCFVAMLRGIRELGRLNEDAPQQQDMASFLAYLANYAKERGYELTPELDTEAADVINMRMTLEHHKGMIAALQQQIDTLLTPPEETTNGEEESHSATEN